MTRLILLLFFLFPITIGTDKYTLQLQNIIITPTDDKVNGTLSCGDITSISFDNSALNLTASTCLGTVSDATGKIVFIPAGNTATFDYQGNVNWTIVLGSGTSSSQKMEVPGGANEEAITEATTEATTTVAPHPTNRAAPSQTLSGNVTTPTTDNTVTLVPVTTAQITSLSNKKFVLTFTLMKIHTSTETVDKNTQAVVVAVIEGLLLGAILVVFIYRQFFSKKRQQQRAGGAGGFSDPGVGGRNNFAAGGGGNYYDNAAVAYRQNNTSQNPSYGYDQPSIRLEERRPASQAAAGTGRVQVDSPSLVPVPLGSDPLAQNQWGDQRNGTTPDRLFT